MIDYFTIESDKAELKLFNGLKAKVISKRTDGYVEVFLPTFNILILVEPIDLSDE